MFQPKLIKSFFLFFLFATNILWFKPQYTQATTNNLSSTALTIIAADDSVEVCATIPGSEDNKYSSLSEYIKDFYIFSIWLITGISIIMIVYGGYTMIISSGNPEMINKGKNTIISALVSLALLVLAYTVLRIISPQIITNPKPTATSTTSNSSTGSSFPSNNVLSGSSDGFPAPIPPAT